jgi:hypothetical protein
MSSVDREGEALGRLARLARDAGSGEVDPGLDHAGRERLLTELAGREALGRTGRGRRPYWVALVAAVAVAAAVFFAWPRSRLGFSVEGATLAEGGYVAPARADASAVVRFTEGTEVAFGAGARGRIAEVTSRGARIVLESGEARLDVTHRPGAEWSVEAGPFVISVTGTAFEVRWTGAVLEVEMLRGSVLVRGPLAPGGIALRAGQVLTARPDDGELRIGGDESGPRAAAPAAPAASAPDEQAAVPVAAPPPASAPSAREAPRAATWSSRVASGDFAGVIADAESRGLDTTLNQAGLADLVALADAARYAGRTEIARRTLAAQRARFAGTAEARAAAFLLGRIADDGGSPGSAIGFYDQYLAEAPGGVFAAEALGRKMVAVRRTSGADAARVLAEEYLRRFPDGSYSARARELAPNPGP